MLQDIVQAYADTVHVAMTLRAPRLPAWPRDDERPARRRSSEWQQWLVAVAGLIGLSSWH
ncbi:MAG TPA: hypothetical protein VMQ73_19495 [Methylomirabilota bacterium]|nr:hypothetical protein [Methylomirabilota bacterium]